MTCRVWTDASSSEAEAEAAKNLATSVGAGVGERQIGAMDAHTEFAMGVDWCMFGQPGWCASCGWDERVLVWDVYAAMNGFGKL